MSEVGVEGWNYTCYKCYRWCVIEISVGIARKSEICYRYYTKNLFSIYSILFSILFYFLLLSVIKEEEKRGK